MSAAILSRKQRQKEGKRTAVAIGVSIAFHLFLILLIALVVTLGPKTLPPAPQDETPVEITFVDNPLPKPRVEPQYMETSEANRSEKPPENPVFESDKDTQASSSQPASGAIPLPTLDGENSPRVSLENRDYSLGREPRPAPPPQPEQQQTTPPEPETKPEPTPEPETKPLPTPKPATSAIALLEPPKPKTEPKPETQKPTEKAQPKPAQPSSPGYQPQERVTRIRGNISNRGRASVAANATPLGRYKKQLSDAIGSRWYYYVNDQLGLLDIGTLEVRFIVQKDGKVRNLKVVSNSSNESFVACSVQAIMEAEIPPIPQEIVPLLEGGQIEIEYSFTIISN